MGCGGGGMCCGGGVYETGLNTGSGSVLRLLAGRSIVEGSPIPKGGGRGGAGCGRSGVWSTRGLPAAKDPPLRVDGGLGGPALAYLLIPGVRATMSRSLSRSRR